MVLVSVLVNTGIGLLKKKTEQYIKQKLLRAKLKQE